MLTYQEYEIIKKEIIALNLTAEEYETAIKNLCEELEL